MTAYAFGDNEVAARRLRILASVYDASTRAFVRAWTQSYKGAAKVVISAVRSGIPRGC